MNYLDLILRPSRWFMSLLILLSAGAMLIVVFSEIPWYIQMLLAIAILWEMITTWRLHVYSRVAIVRLQTKDGKNWKLKNRGGEQYEASLHDVTAIKNYVIILRFKLPQRKKTKTVLLFGDVVPPAMIRKLRAGLFR